MEKERVMTKLLTTMASFLVIVFASSGLRASEFTDIMNSMQNAEIEYERIGHYYRPFKVFKKGDDWILEQQENYESSEIKDEGNNKISVNDFPSNWTINGTWTFSKDGAKCKIDHDDGGMVMTWNC
jgi:hypothetical protein